MLFRSRQRRPTTNAKFLHAKLLGDDGKPQVCVIYRVGDRDVFYALLLPDGSRSSTKAYISKTQFPTIVKGWVD